MADYPIFETPPQALAELRSRTGWTAARADRWLRDVARYGRRSPHFDADRFVGLLREAKDAGATTYVVGLAVGEGDGTVAGWLNGSRRPRPTTDLYYRKPPCSMRGCTKPRYGAKDVCRSHDLAERRAEYFARPEVIARSAEYHTEYEASMQLRPCRMPFCNQIAGARRGWCRSHDGELGHDAMTKRFGVAEAKRLWVAHIEGGQRIYMPAVVDHWRRRPTKLYAGVFSPLRGTADLAKFGVTLRSFEQRFGEHEVAVGMPFIPLFTIDEPSLDNYDREACLKSLVQRNRDALRRRTTSGEFTTLGGLRYLLDALAEMEGRELSKIGRLWTPSLDLWLPAGGKGLSVATPSQTAQVARTA